ncbi:MAG: HDOD domain-containing protein, partial [Planctomycetes bacterium]|nr:HDOD domain-containing protein [Planctomycetota bacterium]
MAGESEQNLSSQGRLSAQHLEVMIRGVDSLATFASIKCRVLELAAGTDTGETGATQTSMPAEALQLLASDPPLTARLLSMANVDTDIEVRTIEQAVELLGFDAVYSTALSTEVFEDNPFPTGLPDRPALWKHSLATAIAAKMLAPHLFEAVDADEAYVCGLLHDLGKFVMDRCMPKSYRRVLETLNLSGGDVAECERRIIGFEHSVIGRRLAEHWRLPRSVRETIWFCHQPIEAIPRSVPGRAAAVLVMLADTIARERAMGFCEDHVFLRTSGQLAGELGISKETLSA